MRLWNDSRTTAIEDGPLILTIADATNEPVTISQYHGEDKLIVQFWTGHHWPPGVRAAENRTFFSNFNRKGDGRFRA